jgi:hypothetical protein
VIEPKDFGASQAVVLKDWYHSLLTGQHKIEGKHFLGITIYFLGIAQYPGI